MKHASLFTGGGGFDLAAEWMGWKNCFQCEIEPFPRKILNYYWPNIPCYEDIRETTFTIWRGEIDVLSGGFPCQPFSLAGQRKGTADSRHLWPQMLRAIREIRPRYIVGENVYGLVNWDGGLVFEEVCAQLEAENYTVQSYIIPACAVNAPHRRDRVWIVAHAKHDGFQNGHSQAGRTFGSSKKGRLFQPSGKDFRLSPHPYRPSNTPPQASGGTKEDRSGNDGKQEERRLTPQRLDACIGLQRVIRNTNGERLEGSIYTQGDKRQNGKNKQGKQASKYLHESKRAQLQFENFPTQPPLCGGNDGVSSKLDGITFSKWRNESIKLYGNAVVPQVVYQLFKAIEETEKILKNETQKQYP